jgi:hypothetical protein
MLKEEQSQFVIKARPYTLYDDHLHKLGPDGVLRQCLTPIETFKVLKEFHEGLVGSHYGSNTIVKKIISISYLWLTIHKTPSICAKDVTFVNN